MRERLRAVLGGREYLAAMSWVLSTRRIAVSAICGTMRPQAVISNGGSSGSRGVSFDRRQES
jgi:hypothetical protein